MSNVSLISGLQDVLKEKRKKVERCEEALVSARADVESYIAKISEALGIKTLKKPGPKKSKTLGPETLGPETLGPQTLGSQTLGSQTLGSQTLGSQTLGSQTLGPQTLKTASAASKSDEVLRLFLDGASRFEIGEELKISLASVYQIISSLRKEGKLPPVGEESRPERETGVENKVDGGSEKSYSGNGNVGENGDDGDKDSRSGDSILALRAEVALQQAGVRSTPVHFGTTPVDGHTHKVIVDRMGDGSTQPDSTGHGHRFYRFVSSQTNKHSHDLLVPMKG